MEQKVLDQVQIRITQLNGIKQQIENTEEQIVKKEHEISGFRQEWEKNCNHVFYRVQGAAIIPYTMGYHCCLCGMFEKLQCSSDTQHRRNSLHYRNNHCSPTRIPMSRKKPPYHYKPRLPTPPKESQDFIGTVKYSIYAEPMEEKELFPIPPEYQAEVDFKTAQLDKLKTEKEALSKNLEELKATEESITQELDKVASLLESYFGYPKYIEVSFPTWNRDDVNYDPFV